MRMPDFFDRVPRIRVHDPLAQITGSAEDGLLEYGYGDAVRVTGHSCPTTAVAYWMTYLGMERLFGSATPQRGGILVDMRDNARTGSHGVVAAVVQMITGAAGSSGFKGLCGRHARAGLMRFSPGLPTSLRFTRVDTQEAVDVCADPSLVPFAPALTGLLQRWREDRASGDELREIASMWQERVRQLLVDCARDEGVFTVRNVDVRPNAGGRRSSAALARTACRP